MKDSEFLSWIWQRMVNVHGEQSNVDYMLRLNGIILSMKDNDAETAISFEQPKPRTKTEYQKVTFDKASEAVKAWEDGVQLFRRSNGEDEIYSGQIVTRFEVGEPFYRKVETEIDERQEFIDECMLIGGLRARDGATEVYGNLYDSGKFKLVDSDD